MSITLIIDFIDYSPQTCLRTNRKRTRTIGAKCAVHSCSVESYTLCISRISMCQICVQTISCKRDQPYTTIKELFVEWAADMTQSLFEATLHWIK